MPPYYIVYTERMVETKRRIQTCLDVDKGVQLYFMNIGYLLIERTGDGNVCEES